MGKHIYHGVEWRIFRIMAEFVEGFDFLANAGPTVAVFGSSRLSSRNNYYKDARKLAFKLAKAKLGVITGGGPGIMEAANRGAKEAGGKSIGFNIDLPSEQKPNPFIKTLVNFHYFFCRKVMFVKETKALIVFPGGYGTMDELFEALTLIQTGRHRKFPVILYGFEYWKGLLGWINNELYKNDYIEKKDLDIYQLVDSIDEIIPIINKFYRRKR